MFELDHRLLLSFLFVGYVDVGTGQVIASSVGPILATILTFLLGILGFFLLRFKRVFKKIREKLCPKKKSSS
ncbi:hypothetical protein AMJ51_00590 [Microgenomates bacterium DG_75]|nr:MAG: hypothetical protein AMJ51_00590 [Microgenomates bacterium DG_75]